MCSRKDAKAQSFFDRISIATSPSLMKGWMPKADGVVEKKVGQSRPGEPKGNNGMTE